MVIEPLHIGFTVADVRAMAAFMHDCLGFEVTEPRRPPATSIEEVTGVIGADVELVYVSAPGLTMELLQYSSPPSATLTGGRPCDVGAAHLALKVSNVADLVGLWLRTGCTKSAGNRSRPKPGHARNLYQRQSRLHDRTDGRLKCTPSKASQRLLQADRAGSAPPLPCGWQEMALASLFATIQTRPLRHRW